HHDWPRADNPAVAFTPDGKAYLTIGDDKGYKTRLRLWDVETGGLRWELSVPRCVVQSLAFTPDGKHLLLAQSFPSDAPPTIRLLNMTNGRDVRKMDSPAPYVELTGFSDDGKWFCLFRVEPTNAICVYETETFKEVWRVEDPKDVKRRLQGGQLTADRQLFFVAQPGDNALPFFQGGNRQGVRALPVSKLPPRRGAGVP